MPRKPQIRGGEYSLLRGPEGAEEKVFAYPTVERARAAATTMLEGGLASRAVIVRPSGLAGVPDFREVYTADNMPRM